MSVDATRDHPPGPIAHLAPDHRSAEEERAWAQLYASIDQAAAAEEVVKQLDADLAFKRNHLALYIRAKTTLREQKLHQARSQRIGGFIRLAVVLLVIGPVRLIAREFVLIRDSLAAAMPPSTKEPAIARMRVLKADPEFASSTGQLGATQAGTQSAEASDQTSLKAA